MKKVLLPTDFSENAYNAVRYAVHFFRNEECSFYLLNTFTPIIYDTEYVSYNSTQVNLEDIYRENSRKGLENVLQRLLKEYPNPLHHFECISSFNLLNEEIRSQVKQKKIELVVMGTQGATGAAQILFGTHTVHAIKTAICPILVIPAGYQFKPLENILFPTDYEINYSHTHLEVVREITSWYDARVHVLNIHFGMPLEEQQKLAIKKLEDYLKDVPHQFHRIEKETVVQGINFFRETHAIDLLVMISNKHSFFENLLFRPVINEIGFQVKIPFLVIPSGKYNT